MLTVKCTRIKTKMLAKARKMLWLGGTLASDSVGDFAVGVVVVRDLSLIACGLICSMGKAYIGKGSTCRHLGAYVQTKGHIVEEGSHM